MNTPAVLCRHCQVGARAFQPAHTLATKEPLNMGKPEPAHAAGAACAHQKVQHELHCPVMSWQQRVPPTEGTKSRPSNQLPRCHSNTCVHSTQAVQLAQMLSSQTLDDSQDSWFLRPSPCTFAPMQQMQCMYAVHTHAACKFQIARLTTAVRPKLTAASKSAKQLFAKRETMLKFTIACPRIDKHHTS